MSGTSEGRHRRVPLWLWPNLLSLDAPAVALAWQWLFHRTWKIPLPFDFQVILATAVWLIYVLDRYLDARGRPADSDWTPRHHFYHQTGGILLGVALVAGAALVTFVWIRLPLAIFEAGMVLGGIVLAHLLTAQCQSRIFDGTGLKEICVATLFMFGVNLDLWLAPLPSQRGSIWLVQNWSPPVP